MSVKLLLPTYKSGSIVKTQIFKTKQTKLIVNKTAVIKMIYIKFFIQKV